jgi:hypothetical protein
MNWLSGFDFYTLLFTRHLFLFEHRTSLMFNERIFGHNDIISFQNDFVHSLECAKLINIMRTYVG